MIINLKDTSLDFTKKTYIMGVVNVTPDSFSDGGLYFQKEAAIKHALKLIDDGADIIDIGGESTRPGSLPVTLDEEIRRTIPVVEELAKRTKIPISIDTYKAEVAKAALDAGASIVNDISALRFDSEMVQVVAKYKAPIILMHIKGTPQNMQVNPFYKDLIPEILDYLKESISLCKEAEIEEDKIIIDPGIGFGKTVEHNLEILANLKEFLSLNKPIAVGVSRKSFIGKILDDAPPSQRLEGTASAVAIAVFNGANIVRVHDVLEMSRVVKIAEAIRKHLYIDKVH
ncbi:MAG: dihydropteroate synthase [Thermodesulfovibrionales bacterium]|nr:dihydropteroate synthase [Thermodesulfovibrionales bacterium]